MNSKANIVMYHYVREIADSKYPAIKGLEYELFQEQIAWLSKNFQFISIEDALWQLDSNKKVLPDNACMLTFDDGYIDHYQYVFPILKKYKIQGSFYIPGKIIAENVVLDVNKIHFILAGEEINTIIQKVFQILAHYRSMGWDILPDENLYQKLAVAERFDSKEVIFVKRLLQNELPEQIRNKITTDLFQECLLVSEEEFSKQLYMSTDQLQEMKDGGMYIGPHGYQHYWLGKITEDEMKEDINRSLETLAPFVDSQSWVMNYPYGSCNQETVDYIQKKGCKMAFVTKVAAAEFRGEGVDRYRIPRFDTNDFPPKSNHYQDY